MFFYFLRPIIRWKVQCLIDEDRTPVGFWLWLLKKDSVSWHYYQEMLKLHMKLQHTAYLMKEAALPQTQYLATVKHVAAHGRRHKRFAAGFVSATILLIACLVLFRLSGMPDHPENSVAIVLPPRTNEVSSNGHTPDDPAVVPVVNAAKSDKVPEYLTLAGQVLPADMREMLRPAMIPLQETYELGREQLLEDLGSLPIQPLTQFGRKLLSGDQHLDEEFRTISADPENSESTVATFFQKWIDFEQIKANWLPSSDDLDQ